MSSKLIKKLCLYSFSIFLAAIALYPLSVLEGAGWGKKEEVVLHEGIKWDRIYFDNKLHFTAMIPNYDGTCFQNGTITFQGSFENASYIIITSYNSGFIPTSLKEFLKAVEEANPDYLVHSIDPKKLGARYALDLIPKNEQTTAFWRFIATPDRIIQMGTGDKNDHRRLFFFESLFIE